MKLTGHCLNQLLTISSHWYVIVSAVVKELNICTFMRTHSTKYFGAGLQQTLFLLQNNTKCTFHTYLRSYIHMVMIRRQVNILMYFTNTLGSIEAYFDGSVQDCSNSIANALELLQSCTKPSINTCVRRFWYHWLSSWVVAGSVSNHSLNQRCQLGSHAQRKYNLNQNKNKQTRRANIWCCKYASTKECCLQNV